MGHEWIIHSIQDKYVADYCNMNINDVENLDIDLYFLYAKDAKIYNLMKTEDGREYLRNAWRIREVQPDRNKLRNQFNK